MILSILLSCATDKTDSESSCSVEELLQANDVMIAVAIAYSVENRYGCTSDEDCAALYYPTHVEACDVYPVNATAIPGFEQVWSDALSVVPCGEHIGELENALLMVCPGDISDPHCDNGECKL